MDYTAWPKRRGSDAKKRAICFLPHPLISDYRPTKQDKYEHRTVWEWRRKIHGIPQQSVYYVQISENKEEPEWQPVKRSTKPTS